MVSSPHFCLAWPPIAYLWGISLNSTWGKGQKSGTTKCRGIETIRGIVANSPVSTLTQTGANTPDRRLVCLLVWRRHYIAKFLIQPSSSFWKRICWGAELEASKVLLGVVRSRLEVLYLDFTLHLKSALFLSFPVCPISYSKLYSQNRLITRTGRPGRLQRPSPAAQLIFIAVFFDFFSINIHFAA